MSESFLLPNWLLYQSKTNANHKALLYGNEVITYRQLYHNVVALASILAKKEVGPHDRVAILSKPSLNFIYAVHAAMQISAIVVPINTRLSREEVAYQLNTIKPRVLLVDSSNLGKVANIALSDSADIVLMDEMVLNSSPDHSFSPRDYFKSSDPLAIIHTSGTTGKPKGIVLTYGNFWWNAVGSALNIGATPQDIWLACMPLFHVGGMSIIIRSVIYGSSILLHEGFDPESVNYDIEKHDVTLLSVVSTMLRRMIDSRNGVRYKSRLRCVLLGGGPIQPDLVLEALNMGLPVAPTYGMTETTSQIATMPPSEVRSRPSSSGRPIMPAVLKVFDENRGYLGPNQEGEIVVEAPMLFSGYWDPKAGILPRESGEFRTGDYGYIDDNGFLYVIDRRDDLIVSGGENISPVEVESVLMSHPEIDDACVTAVADQEWGQIPVASVKLKAGSSLTEEEVISYCKSLLASYKAPKRVIFVESVPRNAAGKLLRNQVSEMHKRVMSEK